MHPPLKNWPWVLLPEGSFYQIWNLEDLALNEYLRQLAEMPSTGLGAWGGPGSTETVAKNKVQQTTSQTWEGPSSVIPLQRPISPPGN